MEDIYFTNIAKLIRPTSYLIFISFNLSPNAIAMKTNLVSLKIHSGKKTSK